MRVLVVVTCLAISACAPSTDALVRETPQIRNTTMAGQLLGTGENSAPTGATQCAEGQWLMCSTSVDQESCSCIVDSLAREKLRRIEEISQQPIS